MKLHRHTDAAALLEAARDLLDAAGAAGDLPRGLLLELARGTRRYPDPPYLALFTDASNPTSNRIYRSVGYAPPGEFLDLRFEPRGAE